MTPDLRFKLIYSSDKDYERKNSSGKRHVCLLDVEFGSERHSSSV